MDLQAYYRGHKKLVGLAALAVIAMLAAGWAIRGRSDDPNYQTAEVQRGSITSVVEATGTINPLTTVPVGSYVSGTVQYVFADFNSRVQAGQVLAQLDPEVYQAQVVQARGSLENAIANQKNLEATITAQEAAIKTNEANLERLKAAGVYSRANTRRILDLADQGVFSKDQADQAQSGLDQSQAQVRAAEAQLNQSIAQLAETRAQVEQAKAQVKTSQGALQLAEANLRYCTIISPIDGTVVANNVTVGQSVAASLQAPIVFSIAQDLTRMQVSAATDESDTGNIKIGTEATFQVDAFPSETFRGRVSAIRLNATTIQNVVTYSTIIIFDNPDGRLLPGETAYATIPTGDVSDTIRIPNAALRFTPSFPVAVLRQMYEQNHIPAAATTSHVGGWRMVWKPESGGSIRPLAVRTGITDYTFTQLISGEVKAGDLLATGEQSPGNSTGANPASPPRFGAPR
ncbi:MAG TPA: efflux RND transporter periplasmic adaptor subunit [Rugosimonospora sp.]|nr:efflux RND transporter periplasmic adaptor subunit [Rugosimonospora sp.]